MASRQVGSFHEVFQQVGLAEMLSLLRPAEYWESHAGQAFFEEGGAGALERRHGIHHFVKKALGNVELRRSPHFRPIEPLLAAGRMKRIPGTPFVAMKVM